MSKTAMQELIFHIAYMERVKYQDEQTQLIGGMNECIMNNAIVIQNRIIEELTKEYAEYLEKEKEQIINTYWDAYKEGQISSDVTAEEYYNEKYLK
jgi:Icc-related predicted phosphoesterase